MRGFARFFVVCLGLIAFWGSEGSSVQAKTLELKFSNYFPAPAAQSKICEEFIRDIEKESAGRIKFRYFPSGTLLTATRMFDGVVEGISDIGLSNIAYTPGRFPVTDILNLPLGFPNAWVANHVVNDFFRRYKPREWEKVHVICLHACGPKFILTKNKPILKLEDFKGLQLRGYGYEADLISALGGIPRSIAMPEIYDAILKGVVEGATLPVEVLKNWRLADVIKYVTECWQIGKVETFYLVMNKDSWNDLPVQLRKVFEEYPFEEKFAQMWYGNDVRGKKYGIEKKGVRFLSLTEDEVPRWQKRANRVVERYVKKMVEKGYSETEVREWLEFIKDRIDYWSRQQRKWRK